MLENAVGAKGVNLNVDIPTETIILLISGIFFAVVLGGILVKLFTKNV